MSETVIYLEAGEPVAFAHRFVTADGELGGSGRPDPKAVRFDGEFLYLSD